MSAADDEEFPLSDLDLFLFEQSEDWHVHDRAHRLKRLELTLAELEANANAAAAAGDQARADDLLKLADQLRSKHAKADRRAAQPSKWRHLLRRYVFNRRKDR